MSIEKQCAEAMARIRKFINATAGQHLRRIRADFAKARGEA